MTHLDKYKLSPLANVVDIETHGKREDAIIATIGCTTINMFTSEIIGQFYCRCKTEDQVRRTWNKDVMDFWDEQKEKSPEAFAEVFDTKLSRLPLKQALEQFSAFLREVNPVGKRINVFGNGPEFDNVILSHAYDSEGVKSAWHYGENQSIRTAMLFGRLLADCDPRKAVPFEGVRHHAKWDSQHEALVLANIVQVFSNSRLES